MNAQILSDISYVSVCIPFLTSVFSIKKVDKIYYPFLYFILYITLSDLLKIFLFIYPFPKSILRCFSNVNILIEALLLTWLSKKWGLFQKFNKGYSCVVVVYLSLWIGESVLFGIDQHFNSYFTVFILFCGVLQCITLINKQAKSGKEMHSNPIFIVSAGFIVNYSIGLICCVFMLKFFSISGAFKFYLLLIADMTYLMMYLVFTYALIIMAKKTIVSKSKSSVYTYTSSLIKSKSILTATETKKDVSIN
jgi:hypothetical protein